MKRYEEYKDSGIEWIGEIPRDWEILKNRYILTRVKDIVGDDEIKFPVLSLSVKGVIEKDRDDNSGKIPAVYANYYQIVKAGNLLLCLFDMDVTPCLVGFIDRTGLVSPAYSYFEPFRIDSIYPKYYYYWYLRMHIENLFIKLSNNVRSSINNNDFKNIVAPFPPINIQQKIADYLNLKTAGIDNLIADKQKLIELLKEKRQATISEAVTKGLDKTAPMKDSRIEWIGEISQGWAVKPFRYCFRTGTGISITRSELLDNGVDCIGYGQIHSKYGFDLDLDRDYLKKAPKSLLETKASALATENDFIFCDTSEDIEGSGNNVYVKNLAGKKLFAGSHTIIARPIIEVNSRFLAYLFATKQWKTQIQSKVYGIKVYSITQKILNDTKLVLPTKTEQKIIADYLDSQTARIDSMYSDITEQIEKIKEYRQSIISEAVTGKVAI